MIDFPQFTIKEMLECGVHFGHKEMLWNPKMAPFIYGSRSNIHIIDLQKTASLLNNAMKVAFATAKKRGSKILFVGTKRQATEAVKEAAISCGQFYVNHRWLGGTLTNWNTVSKSIKKLEELETILKNAEVGEEVKYRKKELLEIDRKRLKLENALGGIRKMGGSPDLIFIIDTNKEHIAIKEASDLNIPIIAVIDTNSNPDSVDYVIPGNDDAAKAIKFYCDMISRSILAGIGEFFTSSGVDISEMQEKAEKFSSKKAEAVEAEVETPELEMIATENVGEESGVKTEVKKAAPKQPKVEAVATTIETKESDTENE